MPEGDTVWLTAHRLDQALRDRELTVFDLRIPQLALADERGRTVIEVLARGKHILMRLDNDLTLHSHLRMDGSWQIEAANGKWSRWTGQPGAGSSADDRRRRRGRGPGGAAAGFEVRALVGNDEWLARGHRVHDLELAPTQDEGRWVGHLGPDVLGPDWDVDEATRRLVEHGEQPVVEALLDQRNLAGVGNMYAAELLFVENVHPLTPVGEVTDPKRLGRTAFRLLRANRDHPEQSTTGSTARGEQQWVYMRSGQPCRRCRTAIRSTEFGVPPRQRNTYWCPTCQPEPESAQ